jgi:hypothetical protein
MNEKERIDIILKEYDTLRKELSDRLDFAKIYITPLLIVSLAGFFGWKSNLSINLALMFALAVLLTFLSFAVNSWHAFHSLSARIAIIEDKVFQISGEPLLTHETRMVCERKKKPFFKLLIIGWIMSCACYIAIEVFLYNELRNEPEIIIAGHAVRTFILMLFIALPLVLFGYLGGRLVLLHRNLQSFESGLLEWIKARDIAYRNQQIEPAMEVKELERPMN